MSYVLRKERLGKAKIVIRAPNEGGDDDREMIVTFVAGKVGLLKPDEPPPEPALDDIDQAALEWLESATDPAQIDQAAGSVGLVPNVLLALRAIARRDSNRRTQQLRSGQTVGQKLLDALPDHVREWDVTDDQGRRLEPTRENVELFCQDMFARDALFDGWQYISYGIAGKNLATGRDGSSPQTGSDRTTVSNAAVAEGVRTAITDTGAKDAQIPASIPKIPPQSVHGA